MRKLFPLLIGAVILAACTRFAPSQAVQLPLSLATFTENDVQVSIRLETNPNGATILSATFTPLDDFHLYSKDIPITGVEGLGRPTLLELPPDSRMKPAGELSESVPAQIPNFEPRELLVYPIGAVTLSLPVQLPAGKEWVDDLVTVTYMSCSDSGCKAPVVGKLIAVRVPGAESLTDD